MTDKNKNINSCLMNMNSLIIRQKINETFIKKLNNGEWNKISNKSLNLVTFNHAAIHSYLTTAKTGNIN